MKKILSFTLSFLLCMSSASVFAEETTAEDTTAAGTNAAETAEEQKSEITDWVMYTHEAADAVLEKEEDEYKYVINNCGGAARGGDDKWDVQFRYPGFSIKKDHKYFMTYSISSDKDGYYYTKIGNLDAQQVGEAVAGEAWHNQFGTSTMFSYAGGYISQDADTDYSKAWTMTPISAGDTIEVSCTFNGIADLPVAEWVFFLGGEGPQTPGGCFSDGTTLYFTNLYLKDETDDEVIVDSFRFNELKGDTDLNGVVDLTDLTYLSLYLLKEKDFSNRQKINADVNADGDLNIGDLPALKRMVLSVAETEK